MLKTLVGWKDSVVGVPFLGGEVETRMKKPQPYISYISVCGTGESNESG